MRGFMIYKGRNGKKYYPIAIWFNLMEHKYNHKVIKNLKEKAHIRYKSYDKEILKVQKTLLKITTKMLLVQYKGGKCEHCGVVASYQNLAIFDFHHIKASEKSFNVSRSCLKFKDLAKEADKCILLCANCHRLTRSNVVILEGN